MTWGAINEWTTQAGYGRLSEVAGHPTLRELLRRIMKQEGGHIDFYASEAGRRLAEQPEGADADPLRAQASVAPGRFGVMPKEEVGFMVAISSAGPRAPWRNASTAASTACPVRRSCTSSRRPWRAPSREAIRPSSA